MCVTVKRETSGFLTFKSEQVLCNVILKFFCLAIKIIYTFMSNMNCVNLPHSAVYL